VHRHAQLGVHRAVRVIVLVAKACFNDYCVLQVSHS
jgi:hypothetical protein